MTHYWDKKFLQHLNEPIQWVFEVGARYGDETLQLSKHFPSAQIYSFECNPNTVNIAKQKLLQIPNVTFFPMALGNDITKVPFYSYIKNNDGASSILKRVDFHDTQQYTGDVHMTTLSEIIREYRIPQIDLLCMDVQGFELNVLKGAGDRIARIRYIIMEEPKRTHSAPDLPSHIHSKYHNAPTSEEISAFMSLHGFQELERLEENKLEDNVLYLNCRFV